MEALSLKAIYYQKREPKNDDLHKIIRENYLQTFHQKEVQGIEFPYHLKREFSRYLKCGLLAHGFARFSCTTCNKDKLVAFSCKGRTLCPSCTGRRMADTARHLVENVIPKVPVRQWVLSMPYKHRFLLSRDSKTLSQILAIYQRAISGFYKKKAKQKNLLDPQMGSIVVIQRFGGALNLNVHFHSLFMDGVYFKNKSGELLFYEIIPIDKDINELVIKIKKRINRSLKKNKMYDDFIEEESMDLFKTQSVLNLVDNNQKATQLGKKENIPFQEYKTKKCASHEGFSLHANVKILASNRGALEKLCRYVARGAIPKERINLDHNGNVLLRLKNAYTDGTSHLKFTPDQFIRRVISLIPPPRQNFIRYFGLFGARNKNRKEITSRANPKKEKKKIIYRTPWADLLKRVYNFEVDYCDSCGAKLKLISSITSYRICKKILDHLGLDSKLVVASRPRGPPVEFSMCENDENSINQEFNW